MSPSGLGRSAFDERPIAKYSDELDTAKPDQLRVCRRHRVFERCAEGDGNPIDRDDRTGVDTGVDPMDGEASGV